MVVIEAMVGFCSDLRVRKGNLLWGNDNCLVVARSVVKVRQKAIDNSFGNIFSKPVEGLGTI